MRMQNAESCALRPMQEEFYPTSPSHSRLARTGTTKGTRQAKADDHVKFFVPNSLKPAERAGALSLEEFDWTASPMFHLIAASTMTAYEIGHDKWIQVIGGCPGRSPIPKTLKSKLMGTMQGNECEALVLAYQRTGDCGEVFSVRETFAFGATAPNGAVCACCPASEGMLGGVGEMLHGDLTLTDKRGWNVYRTGSNGGSADGDGGSWGQDDTGGGGWGQGTDGGGAAWGQDDAGGYGDQAADTYSGQGSSSDGWGAAEGGDGWESPAPAPVANGGGWGGNAAAGQGSNGGWKR